MNDLIFIDVNKSNYHIGTTTLPLPIGEWYQIPKTLLENPGKISMVYLTPGEFWLTLIVGFSLGISAIVTILVLIKAREHYD